MEDENVNRGSIAEQEFVKAYLAKYPNTVVIKATKEQDIQEHWDYSFDGNRIDVKASRKHMGILNLKGDYYTFLELVNRNGETGSLYGNADKLAFEIVRDVIQGFIVVPRLALVNYVNANYVPEEVQDWNLCENRKVIVGKSVLTGVCLETIGMLAGSEYIRKA